MDLTFPDPQANIHLRRGQSAGSPYSDGAAVGHTTAIKRSHAHPERPAFDVRSFILIPLTVEAFGRYGADGGRYGADEVRLFDQLARHCQQARGGKLRAQRCCTRAIAANLSVTLRFTISQRAMGVVRHANGHRHASVYGRDRVAANPDAVDVGPASEFWVFLL